MQMLRLGGISAEIAYKGNLKKRMERANKTGARAAVIIGESEVAEGVFVVRNLQDGSQQRVGSPELLPALAAAGVEDAMLEQMMDSLEAGFEDDDGAA
jgi:histidyl-tRNA synthetase